MCDKRFMPKNRSNVGENVTINRCISTLISFSAFKKVWKGIILHIFDYSYFYAFWVQIFEAQSIEKKKLSYCDSIMYQSFVTAPPSLGPGEQRKLCCFTLHWHVCLNL